MRPSLPQPKTIRIPTVRIKPAPIYQGMRGKYDKKMRNQISIFSKRLWNPAALDRKLTNQSSKVRSVKQQSDDLPSQPATNYKQMALNLNRKQVASEPTKTRFRIHQYLRLVSIRIRDRLTYRHM